MTAIIAAVIPILAKIIFSYMEKRGVDKENQRKFLEAVQCVGALKGVTVKEDFDSNIEDEFDRRDNE